VRLVVGTGRAAGHPLLVGASAGYGLGGLAERAALLGGSLDAGPAPGGFVVRLHVPLAPRAS
jgi:signal transduction histidine kinase